MLSIKTNNEDNQSRSQTILKTEYDWPFKLLLLLLTFTCFRPDLLLPGGKILTSFPVVIIVILFLFYFNSPYKILGNIQTKLIISFLILMVIQLLFARNAYRVYVLLRSFFIFIFLPYLFSIQFLDNPFKIEKYIKLTVIFSLFFALLGITGQGKVSIPLLRDENDFSLWANIIFPFAYFLAQNTSKKNAKLFWYSCTVVFALASITSFSRGGFLGLIAVGFFIIFKSRQKFLAFFLLGVFGIVLFLFTPDSYWSEIKTIQTENVELGTGKIRVETWKAGWKIFLDYPIIGVGANNFGVWLPEYYNYKRNIWGDVCHSIYFTLLPELGIIGTLLFFGMLYANYKNYLYIHNKHLTIRKLLFEKKENPQSYDKELKTITTLYNLSLSFSSAMIAYLVTGAFLGVLYYDYIWRITSFFVITYNISKNMETNS